MMGNAQRQEEFSGFEAHSSNLHKLSRAIGISQNQFSWLFVKCDDPLLRNSLVDELHRLCPIPIEELTLHPSVPSLFSTLQRAIAGGQPPQALMVRGLDSVVALEDIICSTNLMRDSFKQEFSFPLVIWITDEISRLMQRLAPDLKSFANNPISFNGINDPRYNQTQPQPLLKFPKPILSLPHLEGHSPTMYSEYKGFLHSLKNVSNVDEVVCLEPASFSEIPHLIDILRARKCIIVNLSGMDEADAQRSVDFLVGGAFAIDGDQYRIGTSVFVFTPSTVELKFDYVTNSKKGFK